MKPKNQCETRRNPIRSQASLLTVKSEDVATHHTDPLCEDTNGDGQSDASELSNDNAPMLSGLRKNETGISRDDGSPVPPFFTPAHGSTAIVASVQILLSGSIVRISSSS